MKPSGRRAPRVPFLGEAIVYVGNEQLLCAGGNISVSGVLVYPHSPRTVPRREVIRLLFTLVDDRDWVDVDGILVRQVQLDAGFAWGVQFLQIPPELEEQLRRYVLRTPAGIAMPPRHRPAAAPGPEPVDEPWPVLEPLCRADAALPRPGLDAEPELLRLRPLDRDAVERLPPRR